MNEETEVIKKSIELLKEMEAVDSESALLKLKKEIGKKDSMNWITISQKVAAILLLPLICFAAWQWSQINTIHNNVVMNEISTPPTLRSNFTLPDGTVVWLNGNTTIKYPTQFTSSERLIELDGEAYFDIAPNPDQPFLVKTGNLFIEAVGTEFNCLAFSNDSKIETVLTEGKINVLIQGLGERKKVLSLTPNQMVTYNREDQKLTRNKVDPQKYIAWREGKIIFKDDKLSDVLARLGRWYNVEFIEEVAVDQNYAFTGTFNGDELKQILTYIELTTPVQFEIIKTEKNENLEYSKKKVIIKTKI